MMVSVVIPAYNAQDTLPACVESVLVQACHDLEVIIVDDGSTDRTLEVARGLEATHGRVRVVHTENGGVSAARNTGIGHACGKYILFVDSDDCLKPGILRGAVGLAEDRGADLVIFGFDYHLLDEGIVRANAIEADFCGDARAFFEQWFVFISDHELLNPPWNKLILRSLLLEHGVRFNPAYSICEDMAFSADVLRVSQRPALKKGSGYEYRLKSAGSLVFGFYDNYYEALCHYRDCASAYCRRFPQHSDQQALVDTKFINLSIMYLKRIYADSGWDNRRKRDKMMEICESAYFRKALRASAACTRKKRVVCLLAKKRLYSALHLAYRVVHAP